MPRVRTRAGALRPQVALDQVTRIQVYNPGPLDIAAFDVVGTVDVGPGGVHRRVQPATPAGATSPLYVSASTIPAGSYGEAMEWGLLTGTDTSSQALGDLVYLSGAGKWAAVAPTPAIAVGRVVRVGTDGGVLLSPQTVVAAGSTVLWDAVVDPTGAGTHASLAAAVAAGAERIYMAEGTHSIAAAIALPRNIYLKGAGEGRTVLDFGATVGRTLSVLGGASTEDVYSGGGTLAVTHGSTAVVGTATTFNTAGRPVAVGDYLVVDGCPYQVAAVPTDTALTLATAYRGSTAGALAAPQYVILPLAEEPVLEDLTLQNYATDGSNPTVVLDQTLRGRITRCVFRAGVSTGGRTVEIRLSLASLLQSSSFRESPGGSALGIKHGWRCGIRDSLVAGAASNGVVVLATSASLPSDDHFVVDCSVWGLGSGSANGVSVANAATHARRLRVFGCSILGVGQHGITTPLQVGADAAHILEDNYILDCVANGMQIGGPALIKGNYIANSGINGIRLIATAGGGGATIQGNELVGNDYGISVDSGSTLPYKILNNVIRDSVSGAYNVIPGGPGSSLTGPAQIKNNALEGNAGENGGLGTINVETLAGTKTLTAASEQLQKLDGGAANRNVDLPPEIEGLSYVVVNTGATNNLVVRDPATATVVTLTPLQRVGVFSDPGGTAWVRDYVVAVTP